MFKYRANENDFIELTEEEYRDETVARLAETLQGCCCNICGGGVALKKLTQPNTSIAKIIPVCLKCHRTGCAISRSLYINRLNLLTNDAIRIL